ncbi:MAG: ferrous iron transporter B [Phycisphaerae bacterium]|nr:ferrous iron transporter B [Phycisphaerae bacterium]
MAQRVHPIPSSAALATFRHLGDPVIESSAHDAPIAVTPSGPPAAGHTPPPLSPPRIALLGNPNTGKTTLFNRLSGLRHKTSNFPGTTLEARLGRVKLADAAAATDPAGPPAHGHVADLIDLPGIYSLDLDQPEAILCRDVLAGRARVGGGAGGGRAAPPEAVLIVVDATNLGRNLVLVGECLREGLPTVVALNMIDLARRARAEPDARALAESLGCPVVPCGARSGEGLDALRHALADLPARTEPRRTIPDLRAWAFEAASRAVAGRPPTTTTAGRTFTDRVDHVVTHPLMGAVVFALVMGGLFFTLFKLARYPMDAIDGLFAGNPGWAAAWQPDWLAHALGAGLTGLTRQLLPAGLLADFVADGVIAGVGATVIFLPQICLLFFLISLLEDTGYLARGAFVMDRLLRPFGLPGHAFVPLLSSHACALPGIISARGVPDARERLTTILVAPFTTCSARIPVYVMLITLLFGHRPTLAALAFVGCYALGILAAVGSAALARGTILRGRSRPMALELPTYKIPSLRTALLTTWDRALVFLRSAGTNILAICIVLWWLGSFPHVAPPARADQLRADAQALVERSAVAESPDAVSDAYTLAQAMNAEADHVERAHAKSSSFLGMMGRAAQPVFAPLGYDWQLTIGVLSSFAAREVFVSTMSIVFAGEEDSSRDGVFQKISAATRDDGTTPVFTPAVCWSLLIYYILAMQCLPTLAVTAREAGGIRWALLQLAWMSLVAYAAAFVAYRLALALGA